MIDARLRQALEAVDELVSAIGSGDPAMTATVGPARLTVDVGRAAAEWRLNTSEPTARTVRLAVLCDIENDKVTDARLYVGVGPDTERDDHPRTDQEKE